MTLSTETNHKLSENDNDVCPICANSYSKMASPTPFFRERKLSTLLTEGTTRSCRAQFLILTLQEETNTNGTKLTYPLKCKEERRDRTGS